MHSRRHCLLRLLLGLRALPAWARPAAAGPAARRSDARVVSSLADLQAIGQNLQGHYVLERSLDASATAGWNGGAGFLPIGTPDRPFSGIFDGRGYAIHGLVIQRPDADHVGLFGTTRNATLRRLALVGGEVTGARHVGALVGSFAATAGGTARILQVQTCTLVRARADNAGGLVGHVDADQGTAEIFQCSASGPVCGVDQVGGLVGHHQAHRGSADIRQACAHGAVSARGRNAGGLVGHNEAFRGTASITDACAHGGVTAGDYAGGLVGYNDALEGRAQLLRTYALGRVQTPGTGVGGLVGMHTGPAIAGSFYATTDFSGLPINQARDAAGQGRTLAQLQQLATFAGWSIAASDAAETTWRMRPGVLTPVLRGLPPPQRGGPAHTATGALMAGWCS